MRLKIFNEDNSVPFILVPLYEADEGLWSQFSNWASNGLSNIWARITGGIVKGYDSQLGKSTVQAINTGNTTHQTEINAAIDAATKSGTPALASKDSWMQSLGQGVKNLGDKFNKGEWLNEKINNLGTLIQKHPETTAVGLATAGLLGTYYLFQKFKKKEKMTPEMVKKMQEMDNLTPEQVKARMGQNKLQ